jgi:hypothetical protein
MDEKEYYIFSGNSEPFLNIYGKSDAKVLTIFLADDWEKDKMTPHDLYDKRNTKYISLKLNRNTDADILHWLEMQDSKQGAIKRIIREKINKEGNQKDE